VRVPLFNQDAFARIISACTGSNRTGSLKVPAEIEEDIYEFYPLATRPLFSSRIAVGHYFFVPDDLD
jgi:hypothetical protein